jgi:AbrB family looped-hinge helix DNA binding protein
MEKTRISSKGRVVLPKPLLDARRWKAGTELIVQDTKEGLLLRSAKPLAATKLEDVLGCLGYCEKRKTLSQMQAANDEEVKARRGRGRY